MNPLFAKLNYKAQPEIHVVNAPPFMRSHMQEMQTLCRINNRIGGKEITFLLVFVMNSEEIERHSLQMGKSLTKDAIVWFAYPKKTSKKYKSEINRDSGWEPLGNWGLNLSGRLPSMRTGLRFGSGILILSNQ
jgi:hypothetical protein